MAVGLAKHKKRTANKTVTHLYLKCSDIPFNADLVRTQVLLEKAQDSSKCPKLQHYYTYSQGIFSAVGTPCSYPS